MGITAVTWMILPENYIRFGILHLIAFGIIFGALAVRLSWLLPVLGLATLSIGMAFRPLEVSHPFFTPLGITQKSFVSVDYFPLFPWLGIIFLGIGLAHGLSHLGWLKPSKKIPVSKTLTLLGKRALLIYIIHQPFLFGILWVYGLFTK
jgi:uncharacterized membrane protein